MEKDKKALLKLLSESKTPSDVLLLTVFQSNYTDTILYDIFTYMLAGAYQRYVNESIKEDMSEQDILEHKRRCLLFDLEGFQAELYDDFRKLAKNNKVGIDILKGFQDDIKNKDIENRIVAIHKLLKEGQLIVLNLDMSQETINNAKLAITNLRLEISDIYSFYLNQLTLMSAEEKMLDEKCDVVRDFISDIEENKHKMLLPRNGMEN